MALRRWLVLCTIGLWAAGCTGAEDSDTPPDTDPPGACDEDEYDADGTCTDLTVCDDDQYESTPPTETSDRACTDLTVCDDDQYESTPPTETSDRACTDLTVCTDTQYESRAPTETSDRECTDYPSCDPGQVLFIDEESPADSACEPCQDWESCPGAYEPAEACTWPRSRHTDASAPCPLPIEVASGAEHSCALDTTGGVVCWGRNQDGELDVPDGLGEVTHIAAAVAGRFTCAVTTDDEIVCWGTYRPSGAPVASPPTDLTGITQLTAGGFHACALHDDGVTCWGEGDSPQQVVPDGLGDVTQVVAGVAHTCALHDAGSGDEVTCWGDGPAAAVPADLTDVERISGFLQTSCAVHTDGSVTCWGDERLPDDSDPEDPDNPHRGKVWVDVAGGIDHICARDTEGAVSCFGRQTRFVNGDTPRDVDGIVQFDGGASHMCALLDTDEVICWGPFMEDARSERSSAGQNIPPVSLGAVVKVSTGADHACALTTAGTVHCWGNNDSWNNSLVPEFINSGDFECGQPLQQCSGPTGATYTPADPSIIDLTLGRGSSCVVLGSGESSCWGGGSLTPLTWDDRYVARVSAGFYLEAALPGLQLQAFVVDSSDSEVFYDGVIPTGDRGLTLYEPFSSGGTRDAWADIQSCGHDEDGHLACAGNNSHGQASVPDDLNDGPEIAAVGAGGQHTCVADVDGVVTCWGDEADGKTTPPEGLSDIVMLAAGLDHTCAVDIAGDVTCWGANDKGQLDVPPQADDIVQMEAGFDFTCAVDSVGAMFCWGDNGWGQTAVWQ